MLAQEAEEPPAGRGRSGRRPRQRDLALIGGGAQGDLGGARRNPARLFLAGVAIMLGGVLLRVNGFLIGYDTGLGVDHGWNYFPSIAEMLVTMGMFALEVLGYIIITRRFPVLPRSAAAH